MEEARISLDGMFVSSAKKRLFARNTVCRATQHLDTLDYLRNEMDDSAVAMRIFQIPCNGFFFLSSSSSSFTCSYTFKSFHFQRQQLGKFS